MARSDSRMTCAAAALRVSDVTHTFTATCVPLPNVFRGWRGRWGVGGQVGE